MKTTTRLETAKQGLAMLWRSLTPFAASLPGEKGARLASDEALERAYRTMWIDYDRRALVRLMREMDLKDGRVKSVHGRVARDVVRGGLVLEVNEKASSETLKREWAAFAYRVQLGKAEKLKSDARGLVPPRRRWPLPWCRGWALSRWWRCGRRTTLSSCACASWTLT